MGYTDLFKWDYYMMSASVSILANAGITASVVQSGTTDLKTPRVELQSLTGGPIGHVHHTVNSGSVYDGYNGTIQVLVVTDRALNASTHTDYVGTVIANLSNYKNFNTGSVLPYHSVVKMDFRSTNVRIDAESNLDFSALAFEYVIYIRQDAWPS
jgi:hypothetical protein